jgi:organic hydroperoxide reductase OsmC/OhrA
MASLYSTKVTASGGRHGSIRSEDGLLDLKLALPRALGGRGDATNPEQLFAGGYAVCFENALLHPTGLNKLAKQISHTVQGAHCLEGCVEAGARVFFELGPGRALTKMAAGAYPDIPVRCLEDFRTLQGARRWLARIVS